MKEEEPPKEEEMMKEEEMADDKKMMEEPMMMEDMAMADGEAAMDWATWEIPNDPQSIDLEFRTARYYPLQWIYFV